MGAVPDGLIRSDLPHMPHLGIAVCHNLVAFCQVVARLVIGRLIYNSGSAVKA